MLSVCFIFISYFWPARMVREHDAITSSMCLGHERTTSLDWPPGASQPVHGPGPHISPPVPSAPVPAMQQQDWSAAPTALPGHEPMGWPGFSPCLRRHLIAGAALVPQLPCSWLWRQDRPWLPGSALPDSPWGAPAAPAPWPQGAAGLRCIVAVLCRPIFCFT